MAGRSGLPAPLLLGGRVSELPLLDVMDLGWCGLPSHPGSPPGSWSPSPETPLPPAIRTASRWCWVTSPSGPAPQEGSKATAPAHHHLSSWPWQWTPEGQGTVPLSPQGLTPEPPTSHPSQRPGHPPEAQPAAGPAEKGGHVGQKCFESRIIHHSPCVNGPIHGLNPCYDDVRGPV